MALLAVEPEGEPCNREYKKIGTIDTSPVQWYVTWRASELKKDVLAFLSLVCSWHIVVI